MEQEQLGPFRLGKRLGRGGMGTVYAAVHVETGEVAALKVLAPGVAAEEGFRERFRAEIDSLKKLNHPNIVRILGHDADHLYYSMELVEGRSLEEALAAGQRFTWQQVVDIGIQVCRALKHAHDRGVIHRDLKPANLLLAEDGTVKLSDFGIAKLFGATGLTADGGVVGTAEYMAPEQADGRPVTYRADLYSLGGVLYALLAGRPPFRARSLVEMLQMQRFAEPEPVRRFAPDVPEELEQILASLLAKEPENRIPTAFALTRRLEMLRDGHAQRLASGEPPSGSATDFDLDSPPRPDELGETRADDEYRIAGEPPPPLSDEQLRARMERNDLGLTEDLTAGADIPLKPPTRRTAPAKATQAEGARGTIPGRPGRKFLKVDHDALRREELTQPEGHGISWQTGLLAAALLLVGLATWYYLQPPSADRLYQRIREAAQHEDPERLVSVERELATFLSTYQDDKRRAEVAAYQQQLDEYRWERRFHLRIKTRAGRENLPPIEQAYVEATYYEAIDPELALRKLEGLLDLYGDLTGNPCVQVARKRAAELRRKVAMATRDQLELIQQRMDHARALMDAGESEAARRIWRGVVELYADRPWAADQVARARQYLAADMLTPPTQPEHPAADPQNPPATPPSQAIPYPLPGGGHKPIGEHPPASHAPSDDAPSDDAPTDDSPTDHAPSDEAPSDEAPANHAPRDEPAADDTSSHDGSTNAAPTNAAPSNLLSGQAIARNAASGGDAGRPTALQGEGITPARIEEQP